MEEFYKDLNPKQKDVITELCGHVEKRTHLKPVIMYSLPAFKLNADVMIAFDITVTYVGLYTTDQEAINHAKGKLENAIYGVNNIKVDRTKREAIEVLKEICDEVIMKYMSFNPTDLLDAIDDKNPNYRKDAYNKLLELLLENEIPQIDFLFLLRHPKREYNSIGIGLLLNSLKHDTGHKYDILLTEYMQLLKLPFMSSVIEAIQGLAIWIMHKPFLKQTIKKELKQLDLSYFTALQQEKIKVEIAKVLIL